MAPALSSFQSWRTARSNRGRRRRERVRRSSPATHPPDRRRRAPRRFVFPCSITSGRSNRIPRAPGLASRMPASVAPVPPPTSTTVAAPEKSYASTRAGMVVVDISAIVALNWAPSSGCSAKYSHCRDQRWRGKRARPSRIECRRFPLTCQRYTRPPRIAQFRTVSRSIAAKCLRQMGVRNDAIAIDREHPEAREITEESKQSVFVGPVTRARLVAALAPKRRGLRSPARRHRQRLGEHEAVHHLTHHCCGRRLGSGSASVIGLVLARIPMATLPGAGVYQAWRAVGSPAGS